jgi:hypothetical protein
MPRPREAAPTAWPSQLLLKKCGNNYLGEFFMIKAQINFGVASPQIVLKNRIIYKPNRNTVVRLRRKIYIFFGWGRMRRPPAVQPPQSLLKNMEITVERIRRKITVIIIGLGSREATPGGMAAAYTQDIEIGF